MNDIIKFEGNTAVSINDQWIADRDDALESAAKIEKVSDQAEFEQAELILKKLGAIRKEGETERKAFTKPFNDFAKKVKKFMDDHGAMLDSEKARIKGLLVAYHKQVEEKRRAEEREKAEAAIKSDCPFDGVLAEQAQPTTRKVRKLATSIRKVWKMEIVDPASVPRQFCSPDQAKIRAAIKNGEHEITGVKIWQEETIQSR